VWSERSKETGKGRRESKVFQVWRRGTQEVRVSKDRREEKRRGSGTTVRSVEGEEI